MTISDETIALLENLFGDEKSRYADACFFSLLEAVLTTTIC